MEALLGVLADYGSALLEPIAVFATAATLYYARRWFNLSADEKMREALHGAIKRGMEAAVNRVHPNAKTAAGNIEIRSRVLQKTIDYVGENSPGTLKHFGLTPQRLANIVADRLPAFDNDQPTRS